MKKLLLSSFALLSMGAFAQNSWTPQATNFPANFGVDEISIVDANTVWTFAYDGSGNGTYPKIVSKTTNGGATWTTSNITGPGANALVSDLHAIDGNTAWIVTAPHSAGTNGNRIWKTADGGASWTQQTSGYTSASFANHIYFWDANNGWTSGDPKNGAFEMYKTANGGATWTLVPNVMAPFNADEFTYVGMKVVVGDNMWVGTSLGRILKSTDRGTTWAGHFSPAVDFGGVITPGSTAHLTMKDANNGLLIAVDGQVTGGTPSAALYSTMDGGETWEPVEPVGPWYFGDITYVPGTANTYFPPGLTVHSQRIWDLPILLTVV